MECLWSVGFTPVVNDEPANRLDLCALRAVIAMATFYPTTASNRPHIASDAVTEVEGIIADYDFMGGNDSLTVSVVDPTDEETTPHLELYGHACFDASKPVADGDEIGIEHEHGYTEEFLERLAPHLEERLVVETVGFEKCRFPLLAAQWVVWPDGTVVCNSFVHSPNKPSDADEPTGATGSSSQSSV
jgi:hypothetical protein